MGSNILFLTETQTLENDFDQGYFQEHQLILHSDPNDKFKSLGLLKNPDINLFLERFDSMLFAEMTIPRDELPISVLCVYKKKKFTHNTVFQSFKLPYSF